MRDAETTLGIIHERGKNGLPLEDIYRQLYNPHLYIRAYERLRTNKGAMTPGVTGETVDGMSMEKIGKIIETMRFERHHWRPARRVYIPKRNGKLRPLGMPTWTDKLLQEVMRQILEAYYEPQFSQYSHGFRPNRGCHTALTAIQQSWTGMRWFIEGDISQCFDKLNHEVLMAILRENLHDNRFLRLVENLLKAGYLEDWRWKSTHSGSPQGGVISPILSNIYLDRLDQFVERELLPRYNRGDRRAPNKSYYRVASRLYKAKANGDQETVRDLTKLRRTLPEGDPNDPNFRRLHYVRYADDFLLGFIGPKAEAEEIKEIIRDYLRDELKLELSEEKTLITHAKSEKARFLGYDILNQNCNDYLDSSKKRAVNGIIRFEVPKEVVDRACDRYMKEGKPIHRVMLINDSDYSITKQYQAEYRGLVQYYLLAQNVSRFSRLYRVMQESYLKTLAAKHKASVMRMAGKYTAARETEYGPMKCWQVTVQRGKDRPPLVARFGGIPLRRKPKAQLQDIPYKIHNERTDLMARMLADQCEICNQVGKCQVHHIRKLSNLHIKGKRERPVWVQRMVAMRRKTLVVCETCHRGIHRGWPLKHRREKVTGEPCALKGARTVRRGADGKVSAT